VSVKALINTNLESWRRAMKKRTISLQDNARPLLDIVSHGRGRESLTPAQQEHIALAIRRVPEVMVKVSGGARTVRGVEQHMDYIGREGRLGLEADTGEHLDGKGLNVNLRRTGTWAWKPMSVNRSDPSERSSRGRKPPKPVHNIIFSMPPGIPADKVLRAARKFALNEWQLKHRYAMALHTDDDHPHVHVDCEGGERTRGTVQHQKGHLASLAATVRRERWFL
jgi:Relaxase/Mobilisation nuclease domain